MTERQDKRDPADRRVDPKRETAGDKPGGVHGVGKQTERPDLEQKIDESRGPGERTGKNAV